MSGVVTPRSISEAAAALAGAAAQQRPVRIVGGATKLGWGSPVQASALRLSTEQLTRVVIHERSQTATIGAGTPLAAAQVQLARHGLMLAIDPQLGLGQQPAATLGGVLATADSGPLAHHYGPPVDQLLGVTLALSDGTVVRSGGEGQGDAAGPELTRLAIGSFGTLGVLLSVDVRLAPLPTITATALGSSADAKLLREVAILLTRRFTQLQALDVAWREGRGGLLAQLAGERAEAQATEVADAMLAAGLNATAVRVDDVALWARQRAGQRSQDRAVLRIQTLRSELDLVLALAERVGASLVGRAALGVSFMTLNVNQIATVRAALPPGSGAQVLDLPQSARGAVDPWGIPAGPELELMRELKRAYDPAGVCNPGLFVGGV